MNICQQCGKKKRTDGPLCGSVRAGRGCAYENKKEQSRIRARKDYKGRAPKTGKTYADYVEEHYGKSLARKIRSSVGILELDADYFKKVYKL